PGQLTQQGDEQQAVGQQPAQGAQPTAAGFAFTQGDRLGAESVVGAGCGKQRLLAGSGLGLGFWLGRGGAELRLGRLFRLGPVGLQFIQHFLGPAFIGLGLFIVCHVAKLRGGKRGLIQILEAVTELVVGNQPTGVVVFFFVFVRIVLEQEFLVVFQKGGVRGALGLGVFIQRDFGQDGIQLGFGRRQGLLIQLLVGLEFAIQV